VAERTRSCTARQRRGPGGSVYRSAQTCRNVWTAETSRNHGRSAAASTARRSCRPSAPMVAASASCAAAV
jgi:hypothetical protein